MASLKLSTCQIAALKSANETGCPTIHLKGQAQWGGWGQTRTSLQRSGLLDEACRITHAGKVALRIGRHPVTGRT